MGRQAAKIVPHYQKRLPKLQLNLSGFGQIFFSAHEYRGESSVGIAVYIRPKFFVASLNRYAGKGKY